MPLHHQVVGSGPRVVLVHGFTQTSASWRAVADDLARDHQVVLVDAPGHGGSADLALDLRAGAGALADVGGPGTYVGYSMGGRLALRCALDHPEVVERLVVIGATAGIDADAARAERRRSDEDLARQIEADGVPAFLEHWLALPLFAGLPTDPVERAARATNTAAGLASSLRLAGTGTMDPPWWPELPRITAPVLALAGARDERFGAVARRIASSVAHGTAATIPDAGHAVPLEAPAALAEAIRTFVRSPA